MENDNPTSKEKIIAAAEAVFSKKGFDGARITEIAREAEVNSALIYYYFKNKRALLDAIINGFIQETASILIGMVNKQFTFDSDEASRAMNAYREYLISRRQVLKIMMIESIKENLDSPPIFRLVDIPEVDGLDEESVIADLNERGFNLDVDRQQRMVTEFFTGIMPDVSYAIFREKWMKHFEIDARLLEQLYDHSIEATHARHHRG